MLTNAGSRIVTLQEAQSALREYQGGAGPHSLARLRALRANLIEAILRPPQLPLAADWQRSLRPLHEVLRTSGLRELARDEREEGQLELARAALSSGWGRTEAAAGAVAAMLLVYAKDLPLPKSLAGAPEWLRDDYAAYLLEMPRVFLREGEVEGYADYLQQAVALFHAETRRRNTPAALALARVFLPHANCIQSYFTDRNLRDLYRMRGDIVARALAWDGHRTLHALPPRRAPQERIRVGVFSAHFGPQTETYFILANLDHLDRTRFELILYLVNETGHGLEEHAISLCDRFVVLSLEDLATAVRTIREDDLDVLLIGTNMSAVSNAATLLGAHRLARIQIASEASPTTTGIHQVDVLMSAVWNQPAADADDHYTEALVRIPGAINAYGFELEAPQAASLEFSRAGLSIGAGQTVFFSGANYFKILPELSAAWARILARVPDSVLVLMPYNPNWSDRYLAQPFLDRIRAQLAERLVDPARLRVIDPVPARADLHRVLSLADVYLDSFPFAGACSLVDALVAGVPPVLWRGQSARSNHGAAIMQDMCMPETTADSATRYEEIAIRMAGDAPWRASLARRLRADYARGHRPYFDTRSLSERVGAALTVLVKRYDAHHARLAGMGFEALLGHLRDRLPPGPELEPGLAGMTDIALVENLIAPFFRGLGDGGERRCMIDVGACFGQMALPFLTQGWEVHLFEPDPDSRRILEANLAEHAGAHVVAAAAVNSNEKSVRFHKTCLRGLSGIAASPYGAVDSVIEVPALRLADYCREEGLRELDFLKIDAEGHDFEVLAGLDAERLRPRLILLEFGTDFIGQSVATLNRVVATMRAHGYCAAVFCYDDYGGFRQGDWSYELRRLVLDEPLREDGAPVFGNVLLFRHGDSEFLLALHALLDCARPRREFLENDGGAPKN